MQKADQDGSEAAMTGKGKGKGKGTGTARARK
jgi:hypothetical protein